MNSHTCPVISNTTNQENFQNPMYLHNIYQNDFSILVIDDDLINLKVATLFLNKYGYTNIHMAVTGQSALDLIQQNNYSLIILDIGLPDINGYDVCTKIRNNNTYYNVPIIIVSAYETNLIKNKCFSVGANKILSKPLDISKFEITIKNCINDYKNNS